MIVERLRADRRAVAFALLGLALITSAILLAYWGRGQEISSDELRYASRLATEPLGDAVLYPPPDGYLIAAPMLVYKALFETAGLADYAAHRALAIAFVLICAILFFALARRRVGDLWALPPTVLLLFFGYGDEQVLTAERIPGSMALATGLGMFLVLDRATLRRDIVAAILLTISLASHPVGIAFAVGAAVLVLCRPSPGRWRSAWVFLLPSALYSIWWLFLRPESKHPTQKALGELASFASESWVSVTAAISGLAGVLDGPAYDHALGWLAAVFLFMLAAVTTALNWRRLSPQFWATLATLFTLWISTGFTRGDPILMAFRLPETGRYVFPAAFLMLLVLVELAGAARLPKPAAWMATTVLALGLVANIDRLQTFGAQKRLVGEQARARFGATEIASRTVPADFYPIGFFYGSAHDYLAAARAFGSVGYSPAELRSRPAAIRLAADRTLLEAEQLSVEPASSAVPRGAQAPGVLAELQGRAREVGGCLRLRPRGGATSFLPQGPIPHPPPTELLVPPPALAEIALPPAGARIAARRLGDVAVVAARFADVPQLPLQMPATKGAAVLEIPADAAGVPWRLVVYSTAPVSVCGLGSSAE